MAIALVQLRSAYSNEGSFDSDVVAGDTVIVACSGAGFPTSITKTGTCTLGTIDTDLSVSPEGSSTAYIRIYSAIVTISGSCGFTFSGGVDLGFVCAEYSGIASSSRVANTGYGTGFASTTTPITSGVVTDVSGCLCFCHWADETSNPGSISERSGYTEVELYQDTSHYHWSGHTIVGASGTYYGGCTQTNATLSQSIVMVAYRPATGGASGNPWYYYAQQLRSLKDKLRGLLQIPSLEEVKLYGRERYA